MTRFPKKALISALIFCLSLSMANAMQIYTVRSGDYLNKVANKFPISGVSKGNYIIAIKGINYEELPKILKNVIIVGQKIALPQTKKEVDDGIEMYNSYTGGTEPLITKNTTTTKTPLTNALAINRDKNLGDMSGLNNIHQATIQKPTTIEKKTQSVVPTPATIAPKEVHKTITDSPKLAQVPQIITPQTLTNQNSDIKTSKIKTHLIDIDSQNTSQDQVVDEDSDSITIFSFIIFIFKVIIYIAILIGLIIFIIRQANLYGQKATALKSKKRRDHLISRISPVLSSDDINSIPSTFTQGIMDLDTDSKLEEVNADTIVDSDKNTDKIVLKATNSKIDEYHDEIENNIEKKSDISQYDSQNIENNVEFKEEQDKPELIHLGQIFELIDHYIENEKYIEAKFMLEDNLSIEPRNVELRIKLLEIYSIMDDEISFEGERTYLRTKNLLGYLDPRWSRVDDLHRKYFYK